MTWPGRLSASVCTPLMMEQSTPTKPSKQVHWRALVSHTPRLLHMANSRVEGRAVTCTPGASVRTSHSWPGAKPEPSFVPKRSARPLPASVLPPTDVEGCTRKSPWKAPPSLSSNTSGPPPAAAALMRTQRRPVAVAPEAMARSRVKGCAVTVAVPAASTWIVQAAPLRWP